MPKLCHEAYVDSGDQMSGKKVSRKEVPCHLKEYLPSQSNFCVHVSCRKLFDLNERFHFYYQWCVDQVSENDQFVTCGRRTRWVIRRQPRELFCILLDWDEDEHVHHYDYPALISSDHSCERFAVWRGLIPKGNNVKVIRDTSELPKHPYYGDVAITSSDGTVYCVHDNKWVKQRFYKNSYLSRLVYLLRKRHKRQFHQSELCLPQELENLICSYI